MNVNPKHNTQRVNTHVCVYSNSRDDVPRVAQRYRTIAAHTRRRASVPVVFVVFCVHLHSFAGLIRRMPPPTFSDTANTDCHSDTTIFQLRAHWVRISWSIGSEKNVRTCAPGGSQTLDFLRARRAPYPLGQALRQYAYSSYGFISRDCGLIEQECQDKQQQNVEEISMVAAPDKLHGPSMFAIKAKIYGVLYKQSSSIAFDETSCYWSALKSS